MENAKLELVKVTNILFYQIFVLNENIINHKKTTGSKFNNVFVKNKAIIR